MPLTEVLAQNLEFVLALKPYLIVSYMPQEAYHILNSVVEKSAYKHQQKEQTVSTDDIKQIQSASANVMIMNRRH